LNHEKNNREVLGGGTPAAVFWHWAVILTDTHTTRCGKQQLCWVVTAVKFTAGPPLHHWQWWPKCMQSVGAGYTAEPCRNPDSAQHSTH